MTRPLRHVTVADDNFLICVDCGMLAANGGDSGMDTETAAACYAAMAELAADGYVLAMGDTDRDHEFSWSPCRCCDSPLGGYRFHAVLLETGGAT